MNTVDIKASAGRVKNFFLNPDIVLRLNPSWNLKHIQAIQNNSYDLSIYDDKTENSYHVILSVEMIENSVNYRINSNIIEFLTEEMSPALTKLTIRGNLFRKEDLPYWLKGIQNYIMLEEKKGKVIKWLLDRFWLKMSPSQRRIALIIVIAEGIGLVALIAVVIVLQIMK